MGKPRRLGKGPRGVLYCGRRAGTRFARRFTRNARPAPARRYERQYRNCLCHARRSVGLRGHAVYAGKCLSGAQENSRRIRRGGCLDRSRRWLGRGHSQGARNCGRGWRQVLLRKPIRQRRQLARPLQDYSARDMAANRGPDYSLRRRAWHQRHFHWDDASVERVFVLNRVHLHAAGFAFSWPGGDEAHGVGHRACDLRCCARRPQYRDGDRGRLRDGQTARS